MHHAEAVGAADHDPVRIGTDLVVLRAPEIVADSGQVVARSGNNDARLPGPVVQRLRSLHEDVSLHRHAQIFTQIFGADVHELPGLVLNPYPPALCGNGHLIWRRLSFGITSQTMDGTLLEPVVIVIRLLDGECLQGLSNGSIRHGILLSLASRAEMAYPALVAGGARDCRVGS